MIQKKKKQLWFAVTAKDLEFQAFRGSGKGGQKRNKTSSAIRCKHPASGAVGECEEYREQSKNKQTAFKRMCETDEFKSWVQLKIDAGFGKVEIQEGNNPPRKLTMEEV